MNHWESSEPTELNSYHRDKYPSFGAGRSGFIVAHQAPLPHQPTEGAFNYPAARQNFKANGRVGALNHLDLQFGTEAFDPLGKLISSIAAIHPKAAQPGVPT